MKSINSIVEKFFDIEIFKLSFLISCFFYCLPFTNFIFVKILKFFIIWGIMTFVYNFFKNKTYTLKKADYLWFLFLLISGIGCLVNCKSNFFTNIIAIFYLFVQTVLFLGYDKKIKFPKLIKIFETTATVIVALTFITSILSVLIFLFNFNSSFSTENIQAIFGTYEGRLWGIQGNPNSLAQFALVSIWFSVILLFANKYNKKAKKIFLYANITVQMICYVLSNSRSTTLGMVASAIVFCFFIFPLNKRSDNQSIWQSVKSHKVLSFLSIIIPIAAIIIISYATQFVMPLCAKPFQNIDISFIHGTQQDDDTNAELTVKREYLTDDYSNGRFDLWQAGLKVFKENPILGVGIKNVNQCVNSYLSEASVEKTPLLAANMHNIFIQVLVAHGILALIIFILYLFFTIVRIFKFLFSFVSKSENGILTYKLVVAHFSLVCGLLVVNLFDSNILYFFSLFLVPVFWTSISNINRLIDDAHPNCISYPKKRKILFLINNLCGGGAEKVLTDLTNNINLEKNIIEVKTIFNEGKYISELNDNIKYSYILKKPTPFKKRILSNLIKYLPKKSVYNFIITENYDVEIAFLESLPTRILSGSTSDSVKLSWIHSDIFLMEDVLKFFRSKKRLVQSFQSFDRVVCVSDSVRKSFVENTYLYQNTVTIYNPIDKNQITERSKASCDIEKSKNKLTMVAIGRLTPEKGFLRLCEVINKILTYNSNIELWILGEGCEQKALDEYIKQNNLEDCIKLLGFKNNPYPYLRKADLFVSASFTEGYSLVLAEAMVLGKPVLSTATTGPCDLLENGKYGYIVDNSFEGLYNGINDLTNNPIKLEELREKVKARQNFFKLSERVLEVEKLFALKDKINKQSDLFCTVFTPTYNRAYILENLYNSLKRQTVKDFEWVVVDDGSTDNTEELFAKWLNEQNDFNITYHKVVNGGKHRAINKGITLSKGKMFFIVDSDDYLTDNAIERLMYYERTIADYDDFSGISGLRGYNKETAIGQYNHCKYIDADNLQREKFNLTGDKAECYYLDILKRFNFPEISNEKFLAECIVWNEIAFSGYKIRWFNEIIYLGNYLDDGYTRRGERLLLENPVNFLIFTRNEHKYYPTDFKRHIGNCYRYYRALGKSKSINEISDDLLTNKVFLKFCILLYNIKNKFKGKKYEN